MSASAYVLRARDALLLARAYFFVDDDAAAESQLREAERCRAMANALRLASKKGASS